MAMKWVFWVGFGSRIGRTGVMKAAAMAALVFLRRVRLFIWDGF